MTRITETKSVKVDNWGVFFLQKLQNFFNKTDHCDLTLQFNDNSQLKVHRLVLSACTDYFNMLENTCEMFEDVLIMPLDLQADVIVPIVNFMYTGTLEFQYNMYDKLLKTARDMNMTVLLKLLETHKQATSRLMPGGRQPILLNKQAPNRGRPAASSSVNFQPPGMAAKNPRHPVPHSRTPAMAQRAAPIVKHQTTIRPVSVYGNSKAMKEAKPGPSRYDEIATTDTFEGQFDDISYESKPLVTADQIKKEDEPFEELRKGYTNVSVVKRPATAMLSAPPAKKPNLEEVKEFTEAARLRSQMATEEDDSPGFADDTPFDDDDDDEPQAHHSRAPPPKSSLKTVIKQEIKTPPSAGAVRQITVRDESGSVDHAKIISEVLKKYPHLVKKNKNIKLKIMQKTSPSAAPQTKQAPLKMEVRTATPLRQDMSMVRKATEAIRQHPQATSTPAQAPRKIDSKSMHRLIAKGAENMTGPWLCLRCGINGRPISIPDYKSFRNHLTVKHRERIDSRICEHCGWKAEQRNPHLFYHWLTAHNIKSTVKFPSCSECGHSAMNDAALQKHEEENHQRGDLQQCIYCNKVFAKEMDLYEHMKSLHKEKAREDGVIDFSDDEYHVDEEEEVSGQQSQNSSTESKIKILSNITFSNSSAIPFVIDPSQAQTVSQIGGKSQIQLQQITLEPSSEAEALSNVASGIATSLGLVDNANVVIEDSNFHQSGQHYIEHQLATVHGETGTTTTVTAAGGGSEQLTKLITEDGTELQLTQSQKDEIISQLQNTANGGNVVMVLNDDNFIGGPGIQLADGSQLMNAASVPAGQDTNIVVMYSQPTDGQLVTTTNTITTANSVVPVGPAAGVHEEEVATEDEANKMAVATEDETSQVSTQPSEKTGDTQPMEVYTECSQDLPAEEKNKDANVSSEVERPVSQMEDDDDEEEDEEANESKNSEAEEKAAKEREKQKLISELEGDWSEDTEEQPTAAEEKTEEKVTEAKSPTVQKEKPAAEKQEDKNKEEEEEIGQMLNEWNNETKFNENDSDGDLEKKLEKVVGGKKNESKEKTPMETSSADNTADTVDDSLNNSGTQVVIMAAESETEVSVNESDAEKATENKSESLVETEEPEKTACTAKEEEDADDDEKDSTSKTDQPATEKEETKSEDDKTKSKEVVSSLLGDWDEDDDL
ncbi:centrosome-associated zinc finger protein CP190 [Sabethes cyaneus]|uniref:centrosome-associated zinc finger protein CP190 n=1 Tax=Sabethes cyaneus TaxID=53552 RepID=UPI00237E69EC|nr:centrosome-associated zinc finger protein CP190 [Sabethes cyaneus]XP_053692682.1 centrosome-associated zinc finger protein CP190 [Sabethes cyaneus]XP_053692683.1 centrosome-associated zinc finger protein CP190 [Sabethes cyaneus]XP_053692684.1 centrosome-associated zinc finger protein CP190 [Sabethes cyaneus]